MKKYAIDFSHSTIGFSVRHMMASRIYGTFESYSAILAATDIADISDAQISFSIAVASISTKNFDRDVHLVSPDFLMPIFILKLRSSQPRLKKLKITYSLYMAI